MARPAALLACAFVTGLLLGRPGLASASAAPSPSPKEPAEPDQPEQGTAAVAAPAPNATSATGAHVAAAGPRDANLAQPPLSPAAGSRDANLTQPPLSPAAGSRDANLMQPPLSPAAGSRTANLAQPLHSPAAALSTSPGPSAAQPPVPALLPSSPTSSEPDAPPPARPAWFSAILLAAAGTYMATCYVGRIVRAVVCGPYKKRCWKNAPVEVHVLYYAGYLPIRFGLALPMYYCLWRGLVVHLLWHGLCCLLLGNIAWAAIAACRGVWPLLCALAGCPRTAWQALAGWWRRRAEQRVDQKLAQLLAAMEVGEA